MIKTSKRSKLPSRRPLPGTVLRISLAILGSVSMIHCMPPPQASATFSGVHISKLSSSAIVGSFRVATQNISLAGVRATPLGDELRAQIAQAPDLLEIDGTFIDIAAGIGPDLELMAEDLDARYATAGDYMNDAALDNFDDVSDDLLISRLEELKSGTSHEGSFALLEGSQESCAKAVSGHMLSGAFVALSCVVGPLGCAIGGLVAAGSEIVYSATTNVDACSSGEAKGDLAPLYSCDLSGKKRDWKAEQEAAPKGERPNWNIADNGCGCKSWETELDDNNDTVCK